MHALVSAYTFSFTPPTSCRLYSTGCRLQRSIYICVCLSIRGSNGVESDSHCQSFSYGCEIGSKMMLWKAMHMPPLIIHMCVWELENIWLTSISASLVFFFFFEPPPHNKNHYSHFALQQWTFVIPLCRITTPQGYFYSLVIHPFMFFLLFQKNFLLTHLS